MIQNGFYAQSGGVTAVINATACGVLETARKRKTKIGKILAGRNGIIGALTEDLIDTSKESAAAIAALRHTPGGAFGSARYKLRGLEENRAEYERLIEVFKAHDIGYFFYNGGGDSMDTAHSDHDYVNQRYCGPGSGYGGFPKYKAVICPVRSGGFDHEYKGDWAEGTPGKSNGATRQYYNAAGRLPWKNPMGDWRDANNVQQGKDAYTTVRVIDDDSGKFVQWDVTKIVNQWIGGIHQNQGFFLRTVADLVEPLVEVQFADEAPLQGDVGHFVHAVDLAWGVVLFVAVAILGHGDLHAEPGDFRKAGLGAVGTAADIDEVIEQAVGPLSRGSHNRCWLDG